MSTLSNEPDPYSMQHYNTKFQVKLGRQAHNAREVMKHAKASGRYQDMYRVPLEKNKIDDILKKTGYVEHGGRMVKKSHATALRKEAARELRRRQGKPVVGIYTKKYDANASKKLADVIFRHIEEGDEDYEATNVRTTLRSMKQLLDAGADPDVDDADWGIPVILRTILRGNDAMVKLLLEYGANPNVRDPDEYSKTALMLASGDRYHSHQERGYLAIAKLLLDKGADIEARDEIGNTALIWAVYYASSSVAKLLLDRGANVNVKNVEGATPFVIAAAQGLHDIVELMLAKGARIDAADPDGTALSFAVNRGHRDIVALLLNKGADPRTANAVVADATPEIRDMIKTATILRRLNFYR